MEQPTIVSEDQIFVLDVSQIKVREDLPRLRTDLKKLDDLVESLKKYGQLQPIVVNRSYELIAGGRRLAACALACLPVRACFSDVLDPDIMREMEIEENVQREAFTPAEEVLAVEELHRIKQKRFGAAESGKKDSGWGLEDTAEVIGKTEGAVRADLKLAEMIRAFPELKEAKTKSDIKKAVKGIEKVVTNLEAVQKYEEIVKREDNIPVHIEKADAREHMKKMPDGFVNLLLTDPIYGIDIDEIAIGLGGETGGKLTSAGFNYDDDREKAFELYVELAAQSYRFTTPNAHAWVFLGPENFWKIKDIFELVGWIVHIKPFIWVKGPTGQGNQPNKWPTSAYEMALFARKAESTLVVEGKPDWIQVPRIPPSQKRHGAEKPLVLARELIIRTTLPGQVMYDPFMGSGAFIEAALDQKLIPYGCDISDESYATTLARVGEWKQRRINGG